MGCKCCKTVSVGDTQSWQRPHQIDTGDGDNNQQLTEKYIQSTFNHNEDNDPIDDGNISLRELSIDDGVKIEPVDPTAFNDSFVLQRQRAIDNLSYRTAIDSWRPQSIQQLVDAIRTLSNDKSVINRIWMIFYWTACNIEYDAVRFFSRKQADQSADAVFRTKKGVCTGFSNLYKRICDDLNIRCEVVSGYLKSDYYEDPFTEVNHAWNTVEIEEHWYLIESTWGAGYLDDTKRFKHRLEPYYFLTRPNEMIYHHLPEDDMWQLLRQPIRMVQFVKMPKIHPAYFELDLELVSPRYQAHVNLVPGKPYAIVFIRASPDVNILSRLKLNEEKIEGGDQIVFDVEKQLYCCYFAPATVGKHKILIFGKRGGTDVGPHDAALELTLNIEQMPTNPVSFLKTSKQFFDLGLQVVSPSHTNLIEITGGTTHTEILIQAPENIVLIGRLKDSNGEKVQGGESVFLDRRRRLWRCMFAPNCDGVFDAEIMAKKKSDTDSYTFVVAFKIEANQIPLPSVSYPNTWQVFHDLDLHVETPLDRATVVWNDSASYVEIRISAPDDVQLSCKIEYNGIKVENGSLVQFDSEKQQWQLLFAPEQTGLHRLIVYARRNSDPGSSSSSAVKFDLNVTQLQHPIKFPIVYNRFYLNKCRIYEPIEGVLKRGTVVPIHCAIPGATEVNLTVDSEWLEKEGYQDPILTRIVTVGSNEMTIYAKYQENSTYGGLIKYTIQ